MTIRFAAQLALGTAVLVFASLGFVSTVRAQVAQNHFKFEQTDVRKALQQVFKSVNVSYSVSPEVQGTVTMDMNNVSFETLLTSILREVDATYRIENGVYMIKSKVAKGPFIITDPNYHSPVIQTPSAVSMVEDNRYLYVYLGNALVKVDKSDLKVVKSTALINPNLQPQSAPGGFNNGN